MYLRVLNDIFLSDSEDSNSESSDGPGSSSSVFSYSIVNSNSKNQTSEPEGINIESFNVIENYSHSTSSNEYSSASSGGKRRRNSDKINNDKNSSINESSSTSSNQDYEYEWKSDSIFNELATILPDKYKIKLENFGIKMFERGENFEKLLWDIELELKENVMSTWERSYLKEKLIYLNTMSNRTKISNNLIVEVNNIVRNIQNNRMTFQNQPPSFIEEINLESNIENDQINVLSLSSQKKKGSYGFLDTGCSKTSLKERDLFQKLYKTNKKVNAANSTISINYMGDSGPFIDANWIPTLNDDLISIGDLVSMGMNFKIDRDGLMTGLLNNVIILYINNI
jgi:hypothetical protein